MSIETQARRDGIAFIRRAEERGHANHGWLDSHHTFSFADYYDPAFMGYRDLRVINEDRVIGGAGFGTHGHRDMEIVSYVLEGALAHKDSLGGGGVIGPGNIQRMSAGTGVLHSEFNGSKTEPVHFLQIWIEPARHGVAPSYEERRFSEEEKRGRLRVIASPDGREGSATINQDASILIGAVEAAGAIEHRLDPRRFGWAQVTRGELELNGVLLKAGDGVALEGATALRVGSRGGGELMLFDLR